MFLVFNLNKHLYKLEFVNYFVGCSAHQSLVLQYGHTNKYSLPECSVITIFDHLMLNSLEQCLHLKECDAMRFANITTIATATIGISTANKYSIYLLPPSNENLSVYRTKILRYSIAILSCFFENICLPPSIKWSLTEPCSLSR